MEGECMGTAWDRHGMCELAFRLKTYFHFINYCKYNRDASQKKYMVASFTYRLYEVIISKLENTVLLR
jgi:hypothetical protein